MARPRAADYQDKRSAILKKAAGLFAEQGYDGASMTGIATALGVSKALFYHYYPSKAALLHDIIRRHLDDLVAATEKAAQAAGEPRERLGAIVSAILDCYRDADAEHKVQINHLSRLPGEQQAELRAVERRLVSVMAGAVRALNPGLPDQYVKPLAMSVFGTLNWKYMWFRETGPISREEYAELATQVFADGIAAAAVRSRRSSAPAAATSAAPGTPG